MRPSAEQQAKARGEPFGYRCGRCMNCCHNYLIPVNPYDIARLARRTGQTTGAFRETRTRDGQGVLLARKDGGACVFLDDGGCSVHSDRPLVCRLYPIWRSVSAEGIESWAHAAPHPRTKGDYAVTGTIADFLDQQDAHAHIEAGDLYAEWMRRARRVMEHEPETAERDILDIEGDDADLIDMDTAIARHCAAAGAAEPDDLEARTRLHLQILHRQLDDFERGQP